jgi:tetratricopeptide (TPR) repeat protein
MRRAVGRWLPWQALVLGAAPAVAQDALPAAEPVAPAAEATADDGVRASAQKLFDDARALTAEGRLEEACAAFAESYRLDPALGTRFHLAECYERLGKLASAWASYLGVADVATRRGDRERADFARARAEALVARLSHLRISVAERHDGLRVFRDGAPVGPAQWSKAIPADQGAHEVLAEAPGRRPWRTRTVIEGEGTTGDVTVPPLPLLPKQPPPEPSTRAAPGEGGLGAQRIAALVMAGAGAAGLGVGVALAVAAKTEKDEADARCPREDACFADGAERMGEARTTADAATVAFVIGASLAAGGTVLWLTAPSRRELDAGSARLHIALAPSAAGLGAAWRW